MNEDLKKALYTLGLRLQRELDLLTIQYKAFGGLHNELSNPGNVSVINRDGNLEIDIKIPKQLEIIDYGRKPGTWANVPAIQKWVNLKIKPQPKRLRSVSYAVNKKIFEKGISPKLGAPGLLTAKAKKNAYNIEKQNIIKAAGQDAIKMAVEEIKKALIEAKLTQ